jgi:vacuolar-type H+-ATPase subunit B/Vma2
LERLPRLFSIGISWLKMISECSAAQGESEDRSVDQTLDLGWDLLSVFPEGELKRCDPKTVETARKANRYKYMSQSATA